MRRDEDGGGQGAGTTSWGRHHSRFVYNAPMGGRAGNGEGEEDVFFLILGFIGLVCLQANVCW